MKCNNGHFLVSESKEIFLSHINGLTILLTVYKDIFLLGDAHWSLQDYDPLLYLKKTKQRALINAVCRYKISLLVFCLWLVHSIAKKFGYFS